MGNMKPLQCAVGEEKPGLCLGTYGLPGAGIKHRRGQDSVAQGTQRFTPQIWKNGLNIHYSVKAVASHTAA